MDQVATFIKFLAFVDDTGLTLCVGRGVGSIVLGLGVGGRVGPGEGSSVGSGHEVPSNALSLEIVVGQGA